MNTAIFILSKLVWFIIRPESWIVLAMAATLWLLRRGRTRAAIRIMSVIMIFMVAIGFFPIGKLLLRPLETAYPANPRISSLTGIIVLGGPEDPRKTAYWNQVQLKGGAERLTAALALARRFPRARVIFTGGSGALIDALGTKFSGANVARRFFLEQGLSPGRLTVESRSRNTTENARNTLALIRPAEGRRWALVTSAFHMPRAMARFRRAGWRDITPYPVDFRSSAFRDQISWNLAEHLRELNIAVKEYLGVIAYGLLKR